MNALHQAYHIVLQQKHITLKRLASGMNCAEIETIYDSILAAKKKALLHQKSNLNARTLEPLATAFSSSLLPLLQKCFAELLHSCVYAAIEDIEHREIEIIEGLEIEIPNAISKHDIARVAKKFALSSAEESLARFATRCATASKDCLQSHREMIGADCIDLLFNRLTGMFSNLKRIIFTETCIAYNFTQLLCYSVLHQMNAEIMIRWCERINDDTGAAHNDSVSADSKELHGQIIYPRESFIGEGGAWFHPPNRPYDHAVLMFWHPKLDKIYTWQHKHQRKNDGN